MKYLKRKKVDLNTTLIKQEKWAYGAIEVFLIYFSLRCQGYGGVNLTIVVHHLIVDRCGKKSKKFLFEQKNIVC